VSPDQSAPLFQSKVIPDEAIEQLFVY